MRITLNMQSNATLLDMNNQQEQITDLSQQIASGVSLASPSDDPYAWAQSMNIKQGLQEYSSILSGINFGTGLCQSTESALNQLSDLVSQAQQVAITASNTTEASQSATLASQVNGILQQAVTLANSQYNGQYIFGGTSTSIDNSTGAVTYGTDPCTIQVKTGTSDVSGDGSTTVNLTDNDVFSFTSGGNTLNVLQEIWNLGQAIQNGDSSTVSSSITTLTDAFNHINNESAINGATLDDLTNQQSAITAMQTNEKGTLSNLEDTDVAAVTTKLSQAQTAYQAALQVTQILDSLNLSSILSSGSTG